MPLIEKLELFRFRNYTEAGFEFSDRRIVLTGPNGIGKTNLLEALYFLSILRSFRTSTGRELVRIGDREFRLRAQLNRNRLREELEIVQNLSGKRDTRIGRNRIRKSSEFIREFRSVVFVPEDRNISGGSSSFRRRFFDMLISTLDNRYLTALSNYHRALVQRNRALKRPADPAVAAAFEPELSVHCPLISEKRRIYANMVEDEVNRLLRKEIGNRFEIRYRKEYPDHAEECLALFRKNREREIQRGCTLAGPQLDDFEFYLDGRMLRNYGSTGQIRMIALLLKLAEFHLVRHSVREPVAVLVDDVTGELDQENLSRFLEMVSDADQQFFTFTAFPAFSEFAGAAEIFLGEKGE